MTIEIKAPTLPESVPDGTIATWYKQVGDSVSRDELLVDIETDKVVIEVVSPTDGVLQEILKKESHGLYDYLPTWYQRIQGLWSSHPPSTERQAALFPDVKVWMVQGA